MGSIYKLYPRSKPEFYYIGLTTQSLAERLKQHKSCYKCYCNGKGNWGSYFKILENDLDPVMELIEYHPGLNHFNLNSGILKHMIV